jgi:hypothetical protein
MAMRPGYGWRFPMSKVCSRGRATAVFIRNDARFFNQDTRWIALPDAAGDGRGALNAVIRRPIAARLPCDLRCAIRAAALCSVIRKRCAQVLAIATAPGLPTIDRNSRRVDASVRNVPSMREVTMVTPALCTPRVDMHW